MQAKKVYEFQRDKDISKSLGIGKHRKFQDGDTIRITQNHLSYEGGYPQIHGKGGLAWPGTKDPIEIRINKDYYVAGGWTILKSWFEENPDWWEYVSSANESFTRDSDISKSLGIGKYKKFQDGDRIKLNTDIFVKVNANSMDEDSSWESFDYVTTYSESHRKIFLKNDVLQYRDEWSDFSNDSKWIHAQWVKQNPDWWEYVSSANESFTRDSDISKSLGIGKYKKLQTGDTIKIKVELNHTPIGKPVLADTDDRYTAPFHKGVYTITDEYGPRREGLEVDGWWIDPDWFQMNTDWWEYVVNESIDFKRNISLDKALNVGDHRKFNIGDKIIFLKKLGHISGSDRNVTTDWGVTQYFYHIRDFTMYTVTDKADDDVLRITSYSGKQNHYIAQSWFGENSDLWKTVHDVDESFTRDKNITKSLQIGEHRSFKHGDKIRILEDLYWVGDGDGEMYNKKDLPADLKDGEYVEVIFIPNEIITYDEIEGIFLDDSGYYAPESYIQEHPDVWQLENNTITEMTQPTNFIRNENTNKSLGIGKFKQFQDDDNIELTENIYWVGKAPDVDNGIHYFSGSGDWFTETELGENVGELLFSDETILSYNEASKKFYDSTGSYVNLEWILSHSDIFIRTNDN